MGTSGVVVVAVVVGAVAAVGAGGAGFAAGYATGRLVGEPAAAADPRPAAGASDPLEAATDPDVRAEPLPADGAGLPRVTLQVHSDGCGVIRPELPHDPHGLGWSVTDTAGFEVLQRNALGETRYRYFASGTYRVELVAWDGSAYAPISDPVTITC